MTAEKAREIIEIASKHTLPGSRDASTAMQIKSVLLESVSDGITELGLLAVMRLAGLNVFNEEVFNALFLHKLKEFAAGEAQ